MNYSILFNRKGAKFIAKYPKISREMLFPLRSLRSSLCVFAVTIHLSLIWPRISFSQDFKAIKYNNPGLVVDLGVGLWAWPLPMDYDEDGDLDLVVACPDVPYNGIYFFENPGGDDEMPVFKAGKKIGPSARNLQVSMVNGMARVLSPAIEYQNFRTNALSQEQKLPLDIDFKKMYDRIRANQWKYVDYDGDGDQDISIGIGNWTDYGWDNAYDSNGVWKNGPLHGYVFISINNGSDSNPLFEAPQQLTANSQPLDVYGMPSPSFADFDRDGDLDLICGEFLDGFTWFQNTGTRTAPVYAEGKKLTYQGQPIHMDLQMITPTAIDWNGDGWMDLIVGDEDGRVAWVKHTGKMKDGMPVFLPPQYFQQEADEVKFGALVTPVSYDWDADGDDDLICGNTAGYIGFVENLNGGNPPRWAAPKYLKADGRDIRIMAGPNGSIQGPCEAKWGYTTLSVADWNHDGLPDLMVNSIWGKVIWYENVGTKHHPLLTSARPVEVMWEGNAPKPAWNWWNPFGNELATQWRTTPYVMDFNDDGLNDLLMLDHEGFLAYYERTKLNGKLELMAPQRILGTLKEDVDKPVFEALRLNERIGGGSGRRKFCFVDWDKDGELDLLVNSKSVSLFSEANILPGEKLAFIEEGLLSEQKLAGHTTSPTTVDWDKDGYPDLLLGAEDGRLYFLKNPNSDKKD